MSEYQYYEFQAIDRPLDASDRAALRALSTRARITATRFTNHYEWGDFKGDPAELMERWFDLHLYFSNWGSRRLMIRLPRRMVDRHLLDRCLAGGKNTDVRLVGENLILDIARDEIDSEDMLTVFDEEDGDWGSGWLDAIAPLRTDVLVGDQRLFYLLWLIEVEEEGVGTEDCEPMPGIGPLTDAHRAFATFFSLDLDLLEAAAERSAGTARAPSPDALRTAIAGMANADKTALLVRLFEGDPHVVGELRAAIRDRLTPAADPSGERLRAVGELLSRAKDIRRAREKAEAERQAAEKRRQAAEAEKAARARREAIRRRGDSVWREIESEVERRNASGYDKAASLLRDLSVIAEEEGTREDFARRLRAIRERHAGKPRFIERLAGMG